MNRDDIIRLAREAGIGPVYGNDSIERFAALVAAAEREACARVCDNFAHSITPTFPMKWSEAHGCAAAIRARGNRYEPR